MDSDEEEFWTFSVHVMIAILVTCVMWKALPGGVVQHSSSGEDG